MDHSLLESESVEEILRSIRQVINQAPLDPADKARAKFPAGLRASSPEWDEDDEDAVLELGVQQMISPPLAALAEEDVLLLWEEVPTGPSVRLTEAPEAGASHVAAAGPALGMPLRPSLSPPLVHYETVARVSESLNALAERLPHTRASGGMKPSSAMDGLLCQLVTSAMQPYLEAWLNTHLPDMVQQTVEREIHALIQPKDQNRT